MAEWLRSCGVTRVVMESTSDYWKGAYYLLEAEGFDPWVVNARDVKNVPGRPKTDKKDAGGSPRSRSEGCALRLWCTRSRSAS